MHSSIKSMKKYNPTKCIQYDKYDFFFLFIDITFTDYYNTVSNMQYLIKMILMFAYICFVWVMKII